MIESKISIESRVTYNPENMVDNALRMPVTAVIRDCHLCSIIMQENQPNNGEPQKLKDFFLSTYITDDFDGFRDFLDAIQEKIDWQRDNFLAIHALEVNSK